MPVITDFIDGANVYIKANWSDEWTLTESLIPLQLTRKLGGELDTAKLLFRSGSIMDVETTQFQQVQPISLFYNDLFGYWIRIERTTAPTLDWVGGILTETLTQMGAKDTGAGLAIQGADQTFHAVGLEWLLDRRQITTSVHYSDPNEYRTQRPLGFNLGMGNGRDISIKERGNKDTRLGASGVPSFASSAAYSELWNAGQMVDHLIEFHSPSDVSYVSSDPQFAYNNIPFIDYSDLLEWYYPMVPIEGRSTLAVLNDIINPRRGLVWWLEYQHDANPSAATMALVVNTALPAAVGLPGGSTIPAPIFQTAAIDTDTDPAVKSLTVGRDGSNRYDRVRCRGARRVSVFTVSPADGNLVEGWNTSVYEGEYRTADSLVDSEAADRFRRAEKYANVYSRFLLDSNWDGQSSDGSGTGSFEFACPDMPQGSNSILGTETFTIPGLRLLRTLPMRQGYDYADATSPIQNDSANFPAEFMQPFAIIKHDDNYLPLDRAAGQLDEGTSGSKRLKTSYTLRMLKDAAGIEVIPNGSMPHALAKNHFDTGSPAPSKHKVEVDYADMRVTVAAEWDSYCEGYHPNANPTAAPLQELLIPIGERARLDYLAEGTVYDIQNTTVKTVSTGGPLRDDRELCRQIAQVAYEWYSVPRRSLSISYHVMVVPASLGDFVFNIGTGATLRPLNANVTQIVYDFEAGNTTIAAGFAELDFAGLI